MVKERHPQNPAAPFPARHSEYSMLFSRTRDLLLIYAEKEGPWKGISSKTCEHLRPGRKMLLIFDDIRLWNMLKIWRDNSRPKLDLTYFGRRSERSWCNGTRGLEIFPGPPPAG